MVASLRMRGGGKMQYKVKGTTFEVRAASRRLAPPHARARAHAAP